MLTNHDIMELTAFRHLLHQHPEVSGAERETAARVVAALAPWRPDVVITGLGGHGVAAVWEAAASGPTVLFRAELDALPIEELSGVAHTSRHPGTAHLCGHDGHSTILLGLAREIYRKRPARGRVILLFQPAEEDGSGAAAVIGDPQFGRIAPDWAFALHNMPGVAMGQALLAAGPATCASMGVKITLAGRTAHASQPEAGVSPARAMAALMPALMALGPGGLMQPGFRAVTLTHARLGEPAFGIAPGAGEVWATLRTLADTDMGGLLAQAEALARAQADLHGLHLTLTHHDVFAACENHPEATAHLARALAACQIGQSGLGLPFRASEDFGRFGAGAKSAMLFLGAGTAMPMLHNPDYDFPDSLIAPGTALFTHTLRALLG